jgi:hypothetical protein
MITDDHYQQVFLGNTIAVLQETRGTRLSDGLLLPSPHIRRSLALIVGKPNRLHTFGLRRTVPC